MIVQIKERIKRLIWDYNRPFMAKRYYKRYLGYPLNLKNPQDINEKIQWLLCYADTSNWSNLADKYKVREYVTSHGFGDMLVPLYGVWEKAEDIDFDSLPEKFVLKCNHDSGSCKIIDKKTGFNKNDIITFFSRHLKIKYGYTQGELYYNRIKPLIVAEEFIESDALFSSSLIDYKIWCFDGKPYSIWACYNRTAKSVCVNIYDLNWNCHPELSVFTSHYRDGKGLLPKPVAFDRMLRAASVLSQKLPEVRVDFYEVNGIVYFGEMTFASLAGYMDFYTKDYLLELGNQCSLPI